jgi:chromosome segregation ATPase/SAM-dependent methyltransferase
MTEAQSYGNSLPQELSRFLFLEETIAGRRILEVGATSGVLAEFLIELGAARVVCAMNDPAIVQECKTRNATRKIDFRYIDSDALPGDDGAFDLVVDFSLSAALAQGEQFRLTDINRVLSTDGYALSVIENDELANLPAVLPAADEERISYRAFAEALHESFEVVQVYFQSLLLGYFFGAFDLQPEGDGIAPHTGLMQDEPEPASYYFFAFGNAVPVIEDVSLVQLPLSRLLQDLSLALPGNDTQTRSLQEAAEKREQELLADADAREAAAREDAAQEKQARLAVEVTLAEKEQAFSQERVVFTEKEAEFRSAIQTHETSLAQMAEQIPTLHTEVSQLSDVLRNQSGLNEEKQVQLEQAHQALSSRDAQIDELQTQLGEEKTQNQELTLSNRRDADLIAERESWLTASRSENDRLEIEVAKQTDQNENLRQTIEKTIIELARKDEQIRDAELSAEEFESKYGALQGEHLSIQKDFESLKDENAALKSDFKNMQGDFAQSVLSAEQLNETHQEFLKSSAEEKEELLQRIQLLKQDSDAAKWKIAEFEVSQSTLKEERERLAHGVNNLTTESQELKQDVERLSDSQRKLEHERQEIGELFTAAEEELAKQKSAAEALQSSLEKEQTDHQEAAANLREAERQYKSVQVVLAERDKDLAEEKNARYEAMAQRDTLNALMGERADESTVLRDELESLSKELEQKREESQQLQSTNLILEGRSSDQESEMAQLKARLKEDARVIVEQRHTMEGDADQAQRDAKSIETLSGKTADLEASLEKVKEELLDAQAGEEQAKLRAEAIENEKTTLEGQLETVNATQAELRTEMNNRFTEAEELHQKAEQVASELHAELDANFKTAQETWEIERASANQTEKSLREEMSEFDAQWKKVLTENGALADEIRALKTRFEDANDDLVETNDELSELRKEYELIQTREEALKEHHSGLEENLESRSNALKERELELGKTRDSLEEATLSLEEYVLLAEHLRVELDEERLQRQSEELNQVETQAELHAAILDEAQKALIQERARADLFQADLEESQQILVQERTRADLFHAELEEGQQILVQERTRADLFHAELEEGQQILVQERTRADLFHAELEESQQQLQQERARGDLTVSQLNEAQEELGQSSSRIQLGDAQLGEAQNAAQHAHDRADHLESLLEEARGQLVQNTARADLLSDNLQEAQHSHGGEMAKGSLLEAQLQEAQEAGHKIRVDLLQMQADLKEAQKGLLEEWTRSEKLQEEVNSLKDRLDPGSPKPVSVSLPRSVSFSSESDESDRMKRENTGLREERDANAKRVLELEEHIRGWARHVEELKTQISVMDSKFNAANEVQVQLERAEETIARLAMERDDALEHAASSQSDKEGQTQTETEVMQLEDYISEIDALKDDLMNKNERISRLTQRLIEVEGL